MQVVGLITCEKIVLDKGAKVLIRESAQGTSRPTSWKKKVKNKRMKRKVRERRWKTKSRRESRREYQDNHIMSA